MCILILVFGKGPKWFRWRVWNGLELSQLNSKIQKFFQLTSCYGMQHDTYFWIYLYIFRKKAVVFTQFVICLLYRKLYELIMNSANEWFLLSCYEKPINGLFFVNVGQDISLFNSSSCLAWNIFDYIRIGQKRGRNLG